MKNLLQLLFLLPIICFSQKYTVSGVVKDLKNQPIVFVNVVLQSTTDPEKFYSGMTNNKGVYEIEKVEQGGYNFSTSIIGFDDFVESINVSDKNMVKNVALKETLQLSEVVVINRKPIIKRKIDRLEFNIENTILSSQNAYQILKKTPGVLVTNKGIFVRGSKAIIITINDRMTNMTGDDLKNLLESTDGVDIKLVEVITNPSAKYDATGNAVINLKMIKNSKEGYNGRVGTTYDQGIYAAKSVNTRHFIKTEKLSLMGGYRFGMVNQYYENNDVVVYEAANQTWRNDLKNNELKPTRHDLQFSAEYAVDTMNVIKAGMNNFFAPSNNSNNKNPTNIYNNQEQLLSYFSTETITKANQANTTMYFGYDHKFIKSGAIAFETNYAIQNFVDNQVINTDFINPSQNTKFRSDNDKKIKILSSQIDYNIVEKKYTFEIGLKISKVNTTNKLAFEDLLNAALLNSSSNFDYQEIVSAAYVSFYKKLNKWSIKAGLRSEATSVNSNSTNPVTTNENKYINFFPTFNALHKLKYNNSIGFTYGKHIFRPEYQSLNPSKLYYNNFTCLIGDVNLKPTYTDNYSIVFTLHEKYYFDLYYTYEKNPITEIPIQDNVNPQVVYQITNFEKNETIGLDFSTELELKPWWSITLNSNVGCVINNFIGADSKLYKNINIGYNSSINQSFYINEKKGFTAETSFQFSSASVQGPARLSATSNLGIGLRKKLFQNKGEVSLIVSDIYRGEKYTSVTKYGNQNNYYTEYNDSQRFAINFRYKFGNQKIKPKADKEKTAEQKRM